MGAPITYVNGTRIYRWWFNKVDLNKAYLNKTLVFAKALHIKIHNDFNNGWDKWGSYILIKELIAAHRKYNEQEITIEVVAGATVPRMIFNQWVGPSNISKITLVNNGFIRGTSQSGHAIWVEDGCGFELWNNGEISGAGGTGGWGGKGGWSGDKTNTSKSWSKHWRDYNKNDITWQHNVYKGGGCCTNSILWWDKKKIWSVGAGSAKTGPVWVGGVQYKRGTGGVFTKCWNYPVLREDVTTTKISGKPGGAPGKPGKGYQYKSTEKERIGKNGGSGSANTGGNRSGDGGRGGDGGGWGQAGWKGLDGKNGEHGAKGESGKDGGAAGEAIHGIKKVNVKKWGTMHGPTS